MSELGRAIELAKAKLAAAKAQVVSEPLERKLTHAEEAVAVASRYRLDDLKRLNIDREEIERIVSDSIPVTDRAAPNCWTLLPEARTSILRELFTGRRLADALARGAVIATEEDPLRGALEHIAREGPSAVMQMPLASLAAMAPFATHLEGFPPQAEIERRLELLRLLEPFERLAGDDFEGRKDELRALRIYVDVLESEGFLESFARAFSFERKKPLLIFGVGGVGKSTLVAKFLLDHARAAQYQPFPFAYLDFDRRAVMVDEPASLLFETVRQIGLQYGHAYEPAEALRRSWRTLLASTGRRTKGARADRSARDSVRRDFIAFIQKLDIDPALPVLLVLDTFEEVQWTNRAFVDLLHDYLFSIVDEIPRLRIVIAGRAAVPDLSFDSVIELKDFERDDAIAFLRRIGIDDQDTALSIFKQVGGNPLTLRLAAAVLRRDRDTAGDASVKLALVSKTGIQGQLFERILRHVHNPEVRKIAHPGLVLRRVTPEIIREVLAEPCELDLPTPQRAQELFEELKREIALVSPTEDPDVVTHRADVRKLMLQPLRDAEPARVRAIHEAAIAYYHRFDDSVSRAEEIYHLLSRGRLEEASARFVPDAKVYLWSALDELHAPEKAHLADLLGMEIPPEAREAANLETWERATERRVDEYIRQGAFDSALSILAERKQRSTATMLRIREATVLAETGQLERASAVIADAIREYTRAGKVRSAFESLMCASRLARMRDDSVSAANFLAQAETLARGEGDDFWLIRVLTDKKDVRIDVDELAAIAARIDDERWKAEPALLRKTASRVGATDPKLMLRAARLAGGYSLSAEDELKLEQAVAFRDIEREVFEPIPSIWTRVMLALEEAEPSLDVARAIAEVFAREPELTTHVAEPIHTGPKLKVNIEALVPLLDMSIDLQTLGDVFVRRFDRNLASISFEKTPGAVIREALRYAQREGWLPSLLDALRQSSTSADLLCKLDELGIGVRAEYVGGPSLREAAITEQVRAHRTAVALIEQRMCRIEVSGKFRGTGFLVAPNVVLTAAQVVAPNTGEIVARFDYGAIAGEVYSEGVSCLGRVMVIGTAKSAPSLLLLERDVANEPVGGPRASRGAPARRALDLRSRASLGAKSTLFWFWHSEEDGLRTAASDTLTITDGDIAMPANSRDRFAGGPCFDRDFRLVALHCGPHPSRRRECLALPLTTVLQQIREAGHESLIERSVLRLTGAELSELRQTILASFNYEEFNALLGEYLGVMEANVAFGADYEQTTVMALQDAQRRGRLGELLDALADARPNPFSKFRLRYTGR